MRADRTAFHSERIRRQGGEAHLAATAGANGADHRAVVENATHADRAVEAVVGEKLADHEGLRLLRSKLFGKSRPGPKYAGAEDGNTQQH